MFSARKQLLTWSPPPERGLQTRLTPRPRICSSFTHRTSRWTSTSVNFGQTQGLHSESGLASRPCQWGRNSSRTSGCRTPSSSMRSNPTSILRPQATNSFESTTPVASREAYGEQCTSWVDSLSNTCRTRSDSGQAYGEQRTILSVKTTLIQSNKTIKSKRSLDIDFITFFFERFFYWYAWGRQSTGRNV